ncbi:MAG: sulfatase, partial [Candidatus Hydrogenedentota bacterium]
AYRVSVAVVHEDSASSTSPEKKYSSGAASSENAIVDYAETFVAGDHVVPRIVLITIDTLRRDALGCYSPNENSPNIDAFAKSAVLFENAWAPSPWTLPSLASLNTGIAAAVHGATHHERRVPERLDTLAEKLSNQKYLTGAFVANRFLEENRGFIQGFHRYREVLQEGRNSTERVTNHALQWIAANAEQDFFLWLHYFDPHQPYTPPDEFAPDNPIAENFRQAFPSIFWIRAGTTRLNAEEMAALRALYEGEVRYVDDRVGRIFDLLRERGLFENALIIVTTDHGEEFWEHGGFEHGHTLYNELLKIPMLVRLPRGTMGGRRVAAPVSLTALYATILDVCGIQYDASVLSAASLAPAFKGGKIHQENPLFKSAFPMIYEPKQALLFEHFKYIHNLSSGREELYDLAIDPAERINLGSHFPKKIERARESLDHIATKENILRTQLGVEEGETVELEPETRQELRDLGYF